MRIPVTKKPWFGPKKFGYGWSPRSWEGWLVTAAAVAASIGLSVVFPRQFWIPLVLVLGGLFLVVYVTRDTS